MEVESIERADTRAAAKQEIQVLMGPSTVVQEGDDCGHEEWEVKLGGKADNDTMVTA